MNQFGVRWYTCSSATSSAIAGISWMPLAAVPITATRLPLRSTFASHCAEWNDAPANESRPSMSGSFGRLSWPTALMSTLAVSVSSRPSVVRMRTSPVALGFAERGVEHLGAEADVLAEVERIGGITEVVEQHLLLREALRPIRPLEERVAVQVVGHVDATTRVAILEPGAADVVVLLDDDVGHARLIQPVGGGQP